MNAGWVFLVLAVAPAWADEARLPGDNRRIVERCEEAAELERQSKWDEAIAAYLKLKDDAGDELIPTDSSRRRYSTVKSVTLKRITDNAELRSRFRNRFETNAQKLVADAIARRDCASLVQVAIDFLPCQAAGAALTTLGDLEFERGELSSARHAWTVAANYDVKLTALIDAKVQLASLALDQATDADLDAFRRRHPSERGWLAGREGVLADILTELRQTGHLPPPNHSREELITFGVDESRRGVLPARIPNTAPKLQSSQVKLVDAPRDADNTTATRPQRFDFHPIVWHGHALINDGTRVMAYNLAQGKLADAYSLPQVGRPVESESRAEIDGPQSLTAYGSRVYARIGLPGQPGTHLVCLEREPDDAKFRWRMRWQKTVSELAGPGEGTSTFDGCPLVCDGKLYCSWTRTDGKRSTITVAALNADMPERGPLWTRQIAELTSDARIKHRPLLLTKAGPNLICSTDAGLVVAVDAATGKSSWAYTYPSRGPRRVTADLMPVPRDVAPTVDADGRVIIAPFDTGEVFALDAWSGAVLWDRPIPLEVVHLLGAIGRRLIVTVGGQHSGIVSIDTVTGRLIPTWGSLAADRPRGRGMISGDRVYWPTTTQGLRLLRVDGSLEYPPAAFFQLPPGNLAYGDGFLVLVTAMHLHVLKFEPSAPETPKSNEPRPARNIAASAVHVTTTNERNSGRIAPSGLDPKWRFDLPTDELPLAIHERLLLSAQGHELIARILPSGKDAWRVNAKSLTSAVGVGDLILAFGTRAITAIHSRDGTIAWTQPSSENEPLSNATIAGTLFIVRAGQHKLRSWRIDDGQPVWEFASPIDGLNGHFFADDRAVFVQTSAGEAKLLDSQTGTVRATFDTTRHDWDSRPVGTPDGKIVFAAGPSRLRAIDVAFAKTAWTLTSPTTIQSDGSLPTPLLSGGRLWAKFGTNAGSILAAIDTGNGRIAVELPPVPGLVGVRGVFAQDDQIVMTAGRKLLGLDRLGSRRWTMDLPEAQGWEVRRAAPNSVLVSMVKPDWGWAESLPATHQWIAMLIDRTTGKVQSQCKLPAHGAHVVTGASGENWVVAVPGGVWGFPASEAK